MFSSMYVDLLLWHRGMIHFILNDGFMTTIALNGTIYRQKTMDIPFKIVTVIPYYTT